MFTFLATALFPLRRNPVGDSVGSSPDAESRQRLPRLALVPAATATTPVMNSDPSPISKALVAMLKLLRVYVEPPLMMPPPPPALPASNVLLASVVERAVGLSNRVGTDMRGPFTVAALKGLRVDAVVRYEIWAHSPSEVGQAVENLITQLLNDRDELRSQGFLKIVLKATGPSENVFAEDAWRQSIEFDVLFEFPYVDSDGAESLIARIPIDFTGEFNETTLVVDEMARWDNESAPALHVRGPQRIGALSALAFIAGTQPTGTVTITRTFDGATGAATNHPTLASFVAAVAGDNPPERHADVTFVSLAKFLSGLASFKITDGSLIGMEADGVPQSVLTALGLEGTKGKEIGGEDEFVAFLETKIGAADTAAHKAVIMQHAATSTPVSMGDWDKNNLPDEYQSVQFRVTPSIQLAGVTDRLEITFQNANLDQTAILYLRVARGLPT